jgi:hypothetical protein
VAAESDSDHRRLDRRSLAIHRAVADVIRQDPDADRVALENLARLERTAEGSWISEWRALLLGPRGALLSFLVEDSERADRLRQSNLFAGVLSAAERERIFRESADD